MKAETRARIMTALYRDWWTADALAEHVGLSVTPVRLHIKAIALSQPVFSRQAPGRSWARQFRLCAQVYAIRAVEMSKKASAA